MLGSIFIIGRYVHIKMKIFWILLIISPLQIFGQSITGKIIDSDSNQPVEYATIYINGTTNGTLSNDDGYFSLEKAMFPCEIVISHISYNTMIVNIDQYLKSDLLISITPKVIEINQVTIVDQNLREKNIQRFKDEFLGNDIWGKSAILENDSVLIFNVEYYDENIDDSSLVGKPKFFKVEATAPLNINLPLLGYDLQYDLITFIEKYNPVLNKSVIKTLGYYYYKPKQTGSKLKARRYKRNRLHAYYFSPQHFTRSLYNKQLRENGYLVFDTAYSEDTYERTIKKFFEDSCNCLTYKSDEAIITGMKKQCLNLSISYYSNYRGTPLDLTKPNREFNPYIRSKIYFLNDTCVIRKDGTRPGESILFGPEIGNKRIGATLPNDYEPEL